MSIWTLTAAAATQYAVALAFFFVARRLATRPVEGPARRAANAFVLWWYALAAYLAMQGVLLTLAIQGIAPLGLHVGARLVAGPLLCAAVAGLAYHILFILTGRAWLLAPVSIYYACAAVAYDGLTLAGHPTGVSIGSWQVDLAPVAATSPGWSAVLASIGLPVILCSLAFLLIARRLPQRDQRYRGALVGGSLLAWVGSGLFAQLAGNDVEKFVTLVLFGLAAAMLVVLAYYPPPRIQRWLAAPSPRPAGPRTLDPPRMQLAA